MARRGVWTGEYLLTLLYFTAVAAVATVVAAAAVAFLDSNEIGMGMGRESAALELEKLGGWAWRKCISRFLFFSFFLRVISDE